MWAFINHRIQGTREGCVAVVVILLDFPQLGHLVEVRRPIVSDVSLKSILQIHFFNTLGIFFAT